MKITVIATGFNKEGEPCATDSETVAKAQEAKAAAASDEAKADMPEVEPSNISDDEYGDIVEMLNKNKKTGGGF